MKTANEWYGEIMFTQLCPACSDLLPPRRYRRIQELIHPAPSREGTMKLLYLLFVIGLCGCHPDYNYSGYSVDNDRINVQWAYAYSNVTLTAVRDGKVIQIGSPRTTPTWTPLGDSRFDIGPSMTVVRNVRVCAPVTNIVICSDFVGTFQLGAKFYPLQ